MSNVSLLRAFSIVSIGEVAARGAVFLATILGSKTLGPELFGYYVFYWSLVESLWCVSQFGTETYGMRLVAAWGQDVQQCFEKIASFRAVNALVLMVCSWLIIIVFDEEKFLFFFFLSMYLPTYALYPVWIARGLEKLRVVVIGQVTWGVASLFCVLVAYVADVPILVFAAPFFGAACAVSAALITWKATSVTPLRFRLNLTDYGRWFQRAGFFFIAGVLAIVNTNLPIWASRVVEGDAIITFAPAYRYLVMLSGFVGIWSLVLIPRLTFHLRKDRKKALRVAIKSGIASFVVTASISVFIHEFGDVGMKYVLGNDFLDASVSFAMFSPLTVLFALQFAFGSFVTSFGAQHLYAMGLIISILAQCVFIAAGLSMNLDPSFVIGWGSIFGMTLLVLSLAFSSRKLWVECESAP